MSRFISWIFQVASCPLLIICATFLVFLVSAQPAQAQTAEVPSTPPPELQSINFPGTVEGAGTHFAITDSSYLNINLDSTEQIKVHLESIPEMVTMHIESTSAVTSTQLTLSGFPPNATLYKYEDDYHNEVAFTTDSQGRYSYTQDISKPHLIFIQPSKSTKFIKDDATGGDCTTIGAWDAATKTCTLLADSTETIQIDSNGITLNGNNHTLTGNFTGSGVFLLERSNISVKNLLINNFTHGISIWHSNNITVQSNTINLKRPFCCGYGILSAAADNSKITNNFVSEVFAGILIGAESNFNTVTGNQVKNSLWGVLLVGSNQSDNKIINNSVTSTQGGIYAYLTKNTVIEGNELDSNRTGIIVDVGVGNTRVVSNTTSNNRIGIELSSNYPSYADNIITTNTILNNEVGIRVNNDVIPNQIYNNNFIDNTTQARVLHPGGAQIFNLPAPIGGNYWNNYDTSTEGCDDGNGDGFCDAPYVFDGGQDNLPWTKQDGWFAPPSDADNDGIPDSQDACPNESETVNGFQDQDGCPELVPLDSDNDTKINSTDNCPTVANSDQTDSDSDNLGDACDPVNLTSELLAAAWVSFGNEIFKLGKIADDCIPINRTIAEFVSSERNIEELTRDQQLAREKCIDDGVLQSHETSGEMIGLPGMGSSWTPLPRNVPGLIKSLIDEMLGVLKILRERLPPIILSIGEPEVLTAQVKEFNVTASPTTTYRGFHFELLIEVVSEDWRVLKVGDEFFTEIPFLGLSPSFSVAKIHEIVPSSQGAILHITIDGIARIFILLPPTDLAATPDFGQINLSWNYHNPEFIKSYNIYRKVNDETFQKIGESATNSFSDTRAVAESVNTYAISAVSIYNNESELSQPTPITTFGFGGFLQPLTANERLVFKLNSTIPVKFQLTDQSGNSITSAQAKIVLQKISDGAPEGEPITPESSSAADSGNFFRIADNQYIFNLDTKTLSTGAWQIKALINDGTNHSIEIGLR